ncbi:MAG: 50S ribosomal protein L13 [bacterium]
METRQIKKAELTKNWYLIDAKGVRLGKLATKLASLLIGKNKVTKTTNMPNGDAVVVINSKLVDVHTTKLNKKMYYRHSGYMGGLKSRTLEEMLDKFPNRVIEKAVKGMLPQNKLTQKFLNNLFVYENEEYKQKAQNPIKLEIK